MLARRSSVSHAARLGARMYNFVDILFKGTTV
jgi:hypothetical protein